MPAEPPRERIHECHGILDDARVVHKSRDRLGRSTRHA